MAEKLISLKKKNGSSGGSSPDASVLRDVFPLTIKIKNEYFDGGGSAFVADASGFIVPLIGINHIKITQAVSGTTSAYFLFKKPNGTLFNYNMGATLDVSNIDYLTATAKTDVVSFTDVKSVTITIIN